jgi:hypothetical protein
MEAPWRREGHSDSRCCVAAKRGTIKKMEDSPMKTLLLEIEKTKTSIRAKVEHPSHVIKNLFGYRNEGSLISIIYLIGSPVGRMLNQSKST